MESSLCTFTGTPRSSLSTARNPLLLSHSLPLPLRSPKPLRFPLHVRAALTRTQKEEIVSAVREQLENCYLLAGIQYKGMTVKQLQALRRGLPDSVKVLVAKNTLVGKAIEGTPWEALLPCMKGMNAWMFVHTEEIPLALKPFRDLQKEYKLENNDYAGAVFEGRFYKSDDFAALETMPSKADIFAKLLGSLQSPSTALVGTLQAPARDVVLCLKAYVKKLEDQEAAAQTAN